jgi:peptidase E
MTKYILVGGYIGKAPDGGKAFFEELIKGFSPGRKIRILDCLFAEPEEKWKDKFDEDLVKFSNHIDNFELELAHPEKFLEQVKSSDVIFLRGGETELLMSTLKKSGNWIGELEGKTLAGTSAGGDVMAKYSYNLDTKELTGGFGLLPVKFIPHWRSDYNSPHIDWNEALESLKKYNEDLPVYTLKEGEFVVL